MGRKQMIRRIALKDFYGEGRHIYEDQIGWDEQNRWEARSMVSKEIYDFFVTDMGLNLTFYYIDDDTFYGIHRERYPIQVKILPRDRSEEFIGWQCEADTHDEGEVIASFDDEQDIWDNLRINGKTLEQVLERSYIMAIN